MPSYDYPRPALTADIIVTRCQRRTRIPGKPLPMLVYEALLIRRGGEPFQGKWALPGGYVNEGETVRQAASRELREETGLLVNPGDLAFVGLYDEPGRDPRGWVVSGAFHVHMAPEQQAWPADDAVEATWWPLNQPLPELAFDHETIIADWLCAEMAREDD
jgi:8-oxo-dGTP diphosphatase